MLLGLKMQMLLAQMDVSHCEQDVDSLNSKLEC